MAAVLVLEGVGQCYSRGRQRWRVLADVSLTVAAGEVVGILGGPREGKTTLLEIAAGKASPETGRVVFEGTDLASLSPDDRTDLLGDRIAWMPQEDLADFNVLGYVAVPLTLGRGVRPREAGERAMDALKRVGAEQCASRSWEKLSNWERFLVPIARGIISHPALILIDDLLDGLGARGTREAGELLRSLAKELNCAILLSATDAESLLIAHRVISFDGTGSLTNTSNHRPDNLVALRGSRRSASSR
jgi:putative ABC transport system ATP-binding protein